MGFGASSSSRGPAAPKCGSRTGLPLVPCPTCGEEIIELACGPGSKVPGAIFFKCRLHERDVPGSCPWYLFAEKYEKLLIARGLIQKAGISSIRPDVSSEIESVRVAVGHNDGEVEANKTELAPLLDDEACMKNFSDRVEEKLQKLIDLGKLVVVCLVLVGVFVVVGVIIMLLK